MEGINRRIRAFRKLKGLTQLELASKMGVSVSVIGSLERGTKEPDIQLLEKIGQALGVEIDELYPKKMQ